MENLSHLKALIKKNLLVYKANLTLTIIELLFPVLVIFLFLGLKSLFKIKTKTIDNEQDYYEEKNRFISYYGFKNGTYDSMEFHPVYSYCKENNKFIALIGDNFPLEYFTNIYGTTFRFYSSLKELNNYIESSNYGTHKIFNPEICFGMTSYHTNNKYQFKLHFFGSGYTLFLPDIPSAKGQVLDPFCTQPNFNGYNTYTDRGFLFILKSIYDLILLKETNDDTVDISFRTMPQKFQKEKDDPFSMFRFSLGFSIFIAYALPLTINLYKIVKEKESRVKEGMKIMGLKESISQYIFFLILLFI